MRTLKFTCTLVSSDRPLLKLQGAQFTLKHQPGTTTWTGVKPIQLEDTLKIDATLTGIEGSPWSLDITSACDDPQPPAKIFSRHGVIPQGGGQGISKSVSIAVDPCTALMKPQIIASRSIGSKGATTRKPATKKRASPKAKARARKPRKKPH